MRTFQEICTVEFDNVNLLKRGGQKVVLRGIIKFTEKV